METEDTKITKDQWKKVGKCGIIRIGTPIFEEIGANSVVYHGWYDDKDVAVKMVMNANNYLSGELNALRKLEHENIVRYWFKDQGDTDQILFIVLEKCDYTLRQYVIENRLEIDIKPYEVLKQTTKGLCYLHMEDFIHRDLKPSNVLLVKRGSRWLVKISDFGISKQLSWDKTSTNVTSISGTYGYIAPEIIKKEKVSKKSDIFSLGIVFHYVLSGGGDHPFGDSLAAISDNICDENFKPSLDNIKQDYAYDTKTLIAFMLVHDYEERLDIQQVQAHHIFWDDGRKLTFFQEVSDCLEDRKKHTDLIGSLEKGVDEDGGKNWIKKLLHGRAEDSDISSTLTNRRSKDNMSIQDLIRMIRNLKHHYHDEGTSDMLRKELGPLPSGLLQILTSNFPNLLPRVYDLMKRCKEKNLKEFYRTEEHRNKRVSTVMATSVQWPSVGSKHVIKIGEKITDGLKSTVFRGRFDDKDVAVKRLPYDEKVNTELEILRNLDHPNVIKCLYTDKTVDEFSYIVLELCHCSLVKYVEKRSTVPYISLTPVQILKQMTDGLDYLHNGQIECTVHRDLKPSHILFHGKEGHWMVKISDFGISELMPASRTSLTLTTRKGSSGYTAPELLKVDTERNQEPRIRRESDIFSFGIIFYYVLSDGEHPFGADILVRDQKIRYDDKPGLGDLKTDYAHDATTLITSMIAHKWEDRPTVEQVKAHFLFWDAADILGFFKEVSDYLKNERKHQDLISALNRNTDKETGKDWKVTLDVESENLEITRAVARMSKTLQTSKIQHLVRLIRNWKHHYNDSTTILEEFRQEMGELPDGLANFFTSRFPKLLSHTYKVMKAKEQDLRFKQFYSLSCRPDITPDIGMKDHEDEIQYSGMEKDLLYIEGEEESQDADVEGAAPAVLKPRGYQEELAEQALTGLNSLIIAPTGSGKTAVAKEIIQNHIKSGKSKSVLFLVSKTTLARQQYDFFSRHLDPKVNKMAYLIENAAESPVGAIMKAMKLSVLTPQILIDELKKRKSFITFDDISMMIFDECHNATKKHPYKEIMDMLLDFQHANPHHQPVQIAGMTASPGVGKGKSRKAVMDNLVTLLANLDIKSCPSVVVRHKEDLKNHQNEIKKSFIKVHIEHDLFSKKIMKAMELIEGRIRDKGILGSGPDQVCDPPEDRNKQMYENWTVDMIKHAKLNITDNATSQAVIIFTKHLKTYHTLLYLKKHIPDPIQVTSNMVGFDQSGEEALFLRKINSELEKALKNTRVPPMLKKLLDTLETEFDKHPEPRCIIFVPRKLIAMSLVECISNNEKLSALRPCYLTGMNDHFDTGAIAKTKKEESLKSFRDGKCKILIATSVGEEGLDIRACNLVIMYNYVTGEVGRIQRAGCGRTKDIRSMLITPVDSDHIEREKMNAVYAIATEGAIEDLKELSKEQLNERIRRIQESQMRERRLAEKVTQQKVEEASRWKIFCGGCRAFLTNANELRQIRNQHKFVVDPEYLNRVNKSSIGQEEQREIGSPGVLGVGKFYCKNSKCKKYLGMEMQYKSKLYPTLTVKSLVFEDEVGTKKMASQWNKCPFAVEKGMDDSDDEQEQDHQKGVEKFMKELTSGGGMGTEELSEDDAVELKELFAA